ncbi:MAG: ATP-dependent DNA helicase RecG [Clostridia bacterium]|nr:ATP-dependent DNA helicase RecG [Clostridia bacterium]
MNADILKMPVTQLKGISSTRAKLFAKLEIYTVYDLLNFFPRMYVNRGEIREVLDFSGEGKALFALEVTKPLVSARIKSKKTGRAMTVQRFSAADNTGTVKITFFNSEFLKNTFITGRKFLFYGELERTARGISMTSPEYEPYYETSGYSSIEPVYPLTSGITKKLISSCVRQALDNYKESIEDGLEADIIKRNGFMPYYEALCEVHFPSDENKLKNARKRLAFEELYNFYLKMLFLSDKSRKGRAYRVNYPDMKKFVSELPFTLTYPQKRAIQDILTDISMSSNPEESAKRKEKYAPPARRLVQGDVGSGKTVVACAALYACAKSSYQALLMAPTGILARQHYESIGKLLSKFGIRTVLLVGGMKASEKRETLSLIESGEAQIVIGTHALIEENVKFKNLALAITDEQHRFGVMQRKALEDKSEQDLKPHTVVMSATPIPRTLALIMYCDLDISIIDAMPVGRKPVKTYAVGTDMRSRVYKFIASQAEEGKQSYIVCPLAQESEETLMAGYEMKAAKEYCDSLKNTPLGKLNTVYIHGKMKQQEKDEIMERFANGDIDVLVSTTVIEVGVNNPNATVMLVENAERFGLSQLHQLRGRVGRGEDNAYCILMSPLLKKSKPDSTFAQRIDTLCKSSDGFRIAEKDLEIRGPGDFFGRRQSGEFRFRIADISSDMKLLLLAKEEAERTVSKYSNSK